MNPYEANRAATFALGTNDYNAAKAALLAETEKAIRNGRHKMPEAAAPSTPAPANVESDLTTSTSSTIRAPAPSAAVRQHARDMSDAEYETCRRDYLSRHH
jgi:hypothetical protein